MYLIYIVFIYSSIHLTSFGITYPFYCETQKESLEWFKKLQKFSVQEDFSDKYKIMQPIGEGSFSVVYEAYEVKKFKRVAVKSIKKDLLINNKQAAVSI